jgi:hypothetical protein
MESSNFQREEYLLRGSISKAVWAELKDSQAYIAGGAMTSIFSGNKINDIDIYFSDVAGKDKTCDYFLKLKGSVLSFETVKAKTFKYKNQIYQLIVHPDLIVPTPQALFDFYDFTICMGAYNFRKFVLHENFFQHLSQRRLIFNHKTKYPICSLMRVRKFLERGYKISYTELIKIALSVHGLNLDSLSVLKDQLEGIDALFLKPLIDKLQDRLEEKYDLGLFLQLIEETFQGLWDNNNSTIFGEE